MKNPGVLAAATVLASLAAFAAMIAVFEQRDQVAVARDQREAIEIGTQCGRRLQETLDHSLSATYALAAVVRERHGVPEGFERLAAELRVVYPAVGNLQLAPGGIIRHIYPVAGQEKALGHNLLQDPRRNKEAFAAVDARRMTLAGPFELIQGGVAVVGRLPIFLPDAAGVDRFWGFATTLIRMPDLLRTASMRDLQDHGYAFVLRRTHPDSGERQVIDASDKVPLNDPVSIAIRVPNGTWTLDLSPRQGWRGLDRSDWLLGFVAAALAGTLVFLLLRWPVRLSAEVRRQTQALQASEEKFRTVADFTYDWEFWSGADGRIIYMTPSVERFTGYPAKAFEDDPDLLARIVHEDDQAMWQEHTQTCFVPATRNEAVEIEFRIRSRDGSVHWLAHVCQPIFAADGTFRGRRTSNRDITARKDIEFALSAQLAFDRALIDAQSEADIGLVVVEGGRITYANAALARLYGTSVEEMKAQESFLVLVHPDDREAALKTHRRRLNGEKFENRYDFRFQRSDGSNGTAEISVATIARPGADPAVLCVLVDITHRVRFEQDLLAAKKSAESANHAKSKFLANMSHELRTPMHAILSFASLGETRVDRSPPEVLGSYFNRIRVSGHRLLGLLNDLLDLAKFEAGRMTVDFRPTDLRGLISEVLAEFETLVTEKQLRVQFLVNVDDSTAVVDPMRITQVVRNFLSNAIKFTPDAGEIEIRLIAANLGGGRHDDPVDLPAIGIEVCDSGIGIPEDELGVVFDKFVQSSKTRSEAGGTGLGLAICKEIADIHRGTLVARNNPVCGITMTFTLPREQRLALNGARK